MDEIKWLEVAVNTTPDRLDEVTAKLTAAGMTGLVIEDEGEFQQFLEQNRQYWDYVDQELMDRMRGVTRVKFYVTDDGAGRVQLEQYTRGLDAEYTVTPLTDNDWAYSWQKYYKPLEVGRRLYVVPEWMRDEPVPEGRSPVNAQHIAFSAGQVFHIRKPVEKAQGSGGSQSARTFFYAETDKVFIYVRKIIAFGGICKSSGGDGQVCSHILHGRYLPHIFKQHHP